MTVKLTILGCGNSSGTPAVGNYWGQCDPHEPKNQRSRTSVAVQSENTTIIIDTGPDFRSQLNRENITDVDAVVFTHAHSDHINGIDDLRSIRYRKNNLVPIYANNATMEEIKLRFDYLFTQKAKIYPEVVKPHIFTDDDYLKPFKIDDIEFVPFEQEHGTCISLGFRFGSIAYSTDVVDLSDKSIECLKGIKTWVVDGAGYNMPRNLAHLTLKDVYRLNEVVQAEQVYITHLSSAMDYKKLCKELPDGYEPAYDGLTLFS